MSKAWNPLMRLHCICDAFAVSICKRRIECFVRIHMRGYVRVTFVFFCGFCLHCQQKTKTLKNLLPPTPPPTPYVHNTVTNTAKLVHTGDS